MLRSTRPQISFKDIKKEQEQFADYGKNISTFP